MTDSTIAPAGTAQSKTVSQVLGEITWLLTQSAGHKQMPVGDLEWLCLPPVLLEQYRMFEGPDGPVAVAFWASVSPETEARLDAGDRKLKPEEWKGGDRPWLIDLVDPFGAQDQILADMAANVFSGKPFKLHQTAPDGSRTVATYDPATAG